MIPIYWGKCHCLTRNANYGEIISNIGKHNAYVLIIMKRNSLIYVLYAMYTYALNV